MLPGARETAKQAMPESLVIVWLVDLASLPSMKLTS